VNRALPGLAIGTSDIGCIYGGMVPAGGTGQSIFANRPWIVDHANYDGPNSLLSAVAVKFTTARRVSLKVNTAFSDSPAAAEQEQMPLEDEGGEQRLSFAEAAQGRNWPSTGSSLER